MMLLPSPPYTTSFVPEDVIVSSPASAYKRLVPEPPSITSFPSPPINMSSPPRPEIVSSPP